MWEVGWMGVRWDVAKRGSDTIDNISICRRYRRNYGANIYYNSGNVGIGTATVSNILQVGGGGRLRIGSGPSDYTLIGTNDTDSGTNTRIGIVGNTFGGENSGRINYMTTSTGPHVFSTTDSGTERMRITSTGCVTIQTNQGVGIGDMTAGSLKIGNNNQNYGQVSSGSTFNMGCIVLECLENTEIALHDAGTANHSLIRYTSNGNITLGRNLAWGTCLIFKGNNGTAWDQTSDHRIKENVKKANLAICYDNVKNINLYRFNYTKAFGNDTHKDRTQLGFIAQQVNLYYPKSITRGKRKLDDNKDVPDLASIDITQVNFTLFGAVKQLIRVVEKQSNRIKRLEDMLNIVAVDDDVENDADEPYVKIVCEGEVDIDSIVPSEPEEKISSSNTSNVF